MLYAVLFIILNIIRVFCEEKDGSSKKKSKFQKDQTSEQHAEDVLHSSEVFIPGRIVLNLWRILRHQVHIQCYT